MASRFVYGVGAAFTEPAVSVPPTKSDMVLTIVGISPGGAVTVGVPTVDPALVNVPVSVHAVYMTDQHADFHGADPNVAANVLALGFPMSSAPYAGAGDLHINVPGVPAGSTNWVQLVVEYAA